MLAKSAQKRSMPEPQKLNNKNKQAQIDAIAEQWVNIVFAHLQAKKLANKKLIKINKTYGYTTQ